MPRGSVRTTSAAGRLAPAPATSRRQIRDHGDHAGLPPQHSLCAIPRAGSDGHRPDNDGLVRADLLAAQRQSGWRGCLGRCLRSRRAWSPPNGSTTPDEASHSRPVRLVVNPHHLSAGHGAQSRHRAGTRGICGGHGAERPDQPRPERVVQERSALARDAPVWCATGAGAVIRLIGHFASGLKNRPADRCAHRGTLRNWRSVNKLLAFRQHSAAYTNADR